MNIRQNEKIMYRLALIGAMALVGGCAMNSVAQESSAEGPVILEGCANHTGDKLVQLEFDADGCPIVANPSVFELEGRDNWICWESIDSDGTRQEVNFELYFDPLMRSPHSAVGKGFVRKKIDPNAPITTRGVDYKYTVDGKDCTRGENDRYYDPRFSVRR